MARVVMVVVMVMNTLLVSYFVSGDFVGNDFVVVT